MGRFAIAFLAVMALGGWLVLWHRWLERETVPVRLLVLVGYVGLLVVFVRLLRRPLLGVPD